MTPFQIFIAYYFSYQLVSFLKYCYNERQGARPGGERRVGHQKTEGEDTEQELSCLLGEEEQGDGPQAETIHDDGGVGEAPGIKGVKFKDEGEGEDKGKDKGKGKDSFSCPCCEVVFSCDQTYQTINSIKKDN
jgi:hypothetical protein